MSDGLVDMASQFKGLPMGDLIGGPLQAACDAQISLANATANFIKVVGFLPPTPEQFKADPQAVGGVRTAGFKFKRPKVIPAADGQGPSTTELEEVELEVPLLALVKVPALFIDSVDITFDMEVKSSTSSKESEDKTGKFSSDMEVGWGCFSLKVHLEGSVATHKENTRTSDNLAKYHVAVHAADKGMPEGLARVLDILHTAIVPTVNGATPALPKAA